MLNRLFLVAGLLVPFACRDVGPAEERAAVAPTPTPNQDDIGCGPGCDDCRLWLFGGSGLAATESKSVISTEGTSWSVEQDLPVARTYSGIAVKSGKVWLFGGSKSNTVYVSADLANWTLAGNIPAAMSPYHMISSFKDKFWIPGGGITEVALSHVFSSTDGVTWTLGGTLPINVINHTVGVINGSLWVYGGQTSAPLSSTIASSNGSTWSQPLSTLPGPLRDMSRAEWNGKVWLAGGHSGSAVQKAVLSSTDGTSWKTVGNLPEPRMRGSMIAFKNKLWFIGGLDANSAPTDTVWTSTDGATWTDAGTLSEPRNGAAIATFSPRCATGVP